MEKRGRGRPKKLGRKQVNIIIDARVAHLMREIAHLSGRKIGETYDVFLVGALPALEHTKKLYEDLARLPEESRAAFLQSVNGCVTDLENAVESARQIDIFNNGQKT